MANTGNRQELYQGFIHFIQKDIQYERHLMNRRIFNAFLWCFIFPVSVSVGILVLVKMGILPQTTRKYLDWMILIFPVFYSLYILGSEGLAQFPTALKYGGVFTTLGQSMHENKWREKVCMDLKQSVGGGSKDWQWIIANFEMDLRRMQYRTKFLTVLAGAVFFLLVQGIDLIGDTETPMSFVKNPIAGWVQSSSTMLWQFVSLAIFLALLHLSGNQIYHSLRRYLDCAQLVALDLDHGR